MRTPEHLTSAALLVSAVVGLFLVLFGVAALASHPLAKRFLLGLASTPRRHWAELVVRAVSGLAFIVASPRLPVGFVFHAAGAVLLATTAVMAVLPHRVHQAFASQAVPKALPYLPLMGWVSLAAGAGVVWCVHVAIVG